MPIMHEAESPSLVEVNLPTETLGLSEKPHEECGFVTLIAEDGQPLDEDAIKALYAGINSLQHRGEHGAGITTAGVDGISDFRGPGRIQKAIPERSLHVLRDRGSIGIGHTRWATFGKVSFINGQPCIIREGKRGHTLFAVNGNTEFVKDLGDRYSLLEEEDASDSRQLAHILGQLTGPLEDRVLQLLDEPEVAGSAFAGVAADRETQTALFFRDKHGLRPAVWGTLEQNGRRFFMVASETIAFKAAGANVEGEILPGMVMKWSPKEGRVVLRPGSYEGARRCLFEMVYFMHPDSKLPIPGQPPENWPLVRDVRAMIGLYMGEQYKEYLRNIPIDGIIPIPESGMPVTEGFVVGAEMTEKFCPLLVRNNDERSFIQGSDTQTTQATVLDKLGLNTDLYPELAPIKGRSLADLTPEKLERENPHVFEALCRLLTDKNFVLIDDSIIHGNSTEAVIAWFASYRAVIQAAISGTPPVRAPCPLGVNLKDPRTLLEPRFLGDRAAMANHIGAKLLLYPNDDFFVKAIQEVMNIPFVPGETPEEYYAENRICSGCINRRYPPGTLRPTERLQTIDLRKDHRKTRPLVAA